MERLQSKGENIGDQMKEIDRALLESLGLAGEMKILEKPVQEPEDPIWKGKYEMIRELYDNLLERVVG